MGKHIKPSKYLVVLTGDKNNQEIAQNIYGPHYFPRKYRYKADALSLLQNLIRINVKAELKTV